MNIGITGHQKLGNIKFQKWISYELRNEIKRLKPMMAYSCLAIGADQLFSTIAIEEGVAHTTVIPCKEYKNTFKKNGAKNYLNLLTLSKCIEELDFSACSENAFLEGGKRVVERSDIIFAIWDGKEAKGLGGTADIVEYAKSLKKKVIHLHSILQVKSFY